MEIYDKYEIVIGLEVHVQLNTKTKIFAGDEADFGAAPNTHISPITLGLPGVLPKLNKAVLEKAIKLGIALNCTINEENHFARKNYFYADLPKGYQISQDALPICVGGYVEIIVQNVAKKIALTRIHMEEDAGKNNHELDENFSLIDLNRAGVPLLEVVSEPDIRSSDEAYAYVTELRKLVRYLDICDGNMEEGSMRCDANVSVRLRGETTYRNRVEVKNMNSIRNVKRAIDVEVKRQIDLYEAGATIEQETRSFNQVDATSFTLRTKENAQDYRYFPEPDLPPVIIHPQTIQDIRNAMPALPKEIQAQLHVNYHLSDYDAYLLSEEKDISAYFFQLIQHTSNYKAAANWINNEIKSYLNESHLTFTQLPVTTLQLAEIIQLVDDNIVSSSGAKSIFKVMCEGDNSSAIAIAEKLNFIQSNNEDELNTWIEQAFAKFPDKILEYRNGKKGNLNLFIGEVMKLSRGSADPKKLTTLLLEKLG
ncbi:MAG TPA: Asp-tRNA(Asn)/Glu-tRNA(Gln) amidotransferase subunit GatB [Chitinophagales bacterium]|jgi:aspartyl-tRNA(Asn)/glutamyl-tRNA(Gln) amidotransferase subunit B|nr:Asp-tRNA(Asn)/Glu-tRNA(Gln) amidotransferase subunit GatB [Chitinophagales bacterium]HQV77309.1 Asp-tRNA(Asn)/Glu-tRNA(Gln) amidotransferase subunit GatB [Chitinophagales bacterium]HQW78370.1 Asp-tRNA(Asn)/Glu-tRNA(Gln) amidotransferase subunit GatB [Chitinophagales bacterium]HRB19479.1 Asp-tRNA(Asn)/Glu-tRNA(Gln) amidotransferase subunit GatB [Chitinophagales bacterium]HRB66778.1 Asp-tRNA(Asn)/Glu-tRNA(Gln) amidotransferase subunit GatB [Chitinophagales bacterium]